MPKKQARNAFYFYMKELEPQLKREGRVLVNGIADIVPIAHPTWKDLPEEEKQRYEMMAKEYKAKMRGSDGDNYKMDNVGNIISKRVNVREVNEKRRQIERRQVTGKWAGKNIIDEKFYFIHFETLCKTVDGDYLPCEIAAVEYTLKRGIIKKFHRFIEPGPIPTGYRYVCMNTSEETHQIPIENFEKADNNYTGIMMQLENFVNPNRELPEYPPFYCLMEKRDMVQYCIEWLSTQSTRAHACRINKVYCIEDLLMDLYIHGEGPKISQSGCLDILTSHHWDYTRNTRCDFHEELECKFCSLAVVQRYAFAFSDALSVIYQLKLTDKHLPSTAEDDVPCVILPSTPMDNKVFSCPSRIHNNYSSGQGKRNDVISEKIYIKKEKNDDDDDDDKTVSIGSTSTEPLKNSLRRPNVAGIALSGSTWNAAYNNSSLHSNNDWPVLGKCRASIDQENTMMGHCNVLKLKEENTCSEKSKPTRPSLVSVRPVQPHGIAPASNPTFTMRGVQSMMPQTIGMSGRGNNMMAGCSTPPVGRGYAPPVGRGYAPPVGRGYAPPVGRGYAPPSAGIATGIKTQPDHDIGVGRSGVAQTMPIGRGGIAPLASVGRGYSVGVGRGYALPVGRGYTPPTTGVSENK